MLVYVETGAGVYRDDAAVAWTFDLPHWGLAGQGHDQASALAALEVATGEPWTRSPSPSGSTATSWPSTRPGTRPPGSAGGAKP